MLKFRRLEAGLYVGQDSTKHYTVWRDGEWWSLAVKELVTTAGVKHAVGQNPICRNMHETKKLCVAIANVYSDLGDGFRGHRSRMTEAIGRAYAAAETAAPQGGNRG